MGERASVKAKDGVDVVSGMWDSRSIGTKNVDPLQAVVFVGSPLTLFDLPLRG